MSLPELMGDIFSGDFSHAWARVEDWWSKLKPAIRSELHDIGSEQGLILQQECELFAEDVISGGLTTASFVKAGLDVEASLIAKEITFSRQKIFGVLNLVVDSKVAGSTGAA